MSPSKTSGASVVLGSFVSVDVPVKAIVVVGVENEEVGEVGFEADEAVGDNVEAMVRGGVARIVSGSRMTTAKRERNSRIARTWNIGGERKTGWSRSRRKCCWWCR